MKPVRYVEFTANTMEIALKQLNDFLEVGWKPISIHHKTRTVAIFYTEFSQIVVEVWYK